MRQFQYQVIAHDDDGFVFARTFFVLYQKERLELDKDQETLLKFSKKSKFTAATDVPLSGQILAARLKSAEKEGRIAVGWQESDGTVHWGELNLSRLEGISV
jgi:hypothetical protein